MSTGDGVVATTERCQLRVLRPEDAEPLQRLYGDPEAMRFVGSDGTARTLEQTAAGVGRLIDHQQDGTGSRCGRWSSARAAR